MVRITEDLLRKRAEHNNCEIFSLEEISLHQQEIERIEVLDKLCRDLKIVYLQSNLIPKIENVGRLKKLEYLNLALNNVTRVENLEGCESLQKLDLTVNFIGELTSIESLRANYHFTELYLTGNPCTEFEGYREYVIATLDQLQWLDGKEVEKSERILAKQEYETIRKKIINQEEEHAYKREKEKQRANLKKSREKREDTNKDYQRGTFAGDAGSEKAEKAEKEEEEEEKRFWQEKTDYTPESRIELHQHIEEKRKRQEKRDNKRLERNKPSKETRFFGDDGRVLNINQAKLDFSFDDDEDNQRFMLDLPCFKYLDTSLIDVDVQPLYVRVTIKSKVFQLALSEEVNPDSSSARRSQTTGHLIIEMPKVKQVVKPFKKSVPLKSCVDLNEQSHKREESFPRSDGESQTRKQHEHLEVESNVYSEMDFSKIVKNRSDFVKITEQERADQKVQSNTEDFIDDEDVPPLM